MNWLVDAVVLLSKGGFVMVPLMVCSVVSVTVLIERNFRVRRARADVSETISAAEDAVYSGNIRRAVDVLDKPDSPVTRVLAAGVKNCHLGERCTERAMEEQGTREVAGLTRHLSWLDTIVTIAPLLGLLGTVTGMIASFNIIATTEGISTPTAITGGVAEALIATATGLAVAIFTLVGYNALQERVKGVVNEIETRGTAMVNALAETGEEHGEATRLSA